MAREKYITITCRVNEQQYNKIVQAVSLKAKAIEIDINMAQFMRHSAMREADRIINGEEK